MVTIIQEELVKKIYEKTGSMTRGEVFTKGKELWFGFRLTESKSYLFEFLVESYDSVKEAKEVAKGLQELFRID